MNRSIQAEGVFGVIKQDIGYTRFRRRGREKVSSEIMLYFLGLNLRRLLDFYRSGKTLQFWTAPGDLEAETFRKPSAKRLSKKGIRINKKTYAKEEKN